MFSNSLQGGAAPSTTTPAGETQIFPEIIDKSNQYQVKKFMGTTKSQYCLKVGCYNRYKQ